MNNIEKYDIGSPNYKIGIKYLNDDQLKNVFPDYDVLLKRIQDIRSNIPNIDDFINNFNKNYQINLLYDHIFSLLGGRGSGKTSLLFSLRGVLIEKENLSKNGDMFFPIIIPEVISSDCSIIGWIITILGEMVNQILDEVKSLEYNQKKNLEYNFFKNCVYNDDNKLQVLYDKVKISFFSKEYNSTGFPYSFTEGTKILADQSEKYFGLIKNFVELINMIVDIKSNMLLSKKKKPLIYIFIDDADLAPHVSSELLNIIPKFLSHPNIIVLLSSSPKLLERVIKAKMYLDVYHIPLDIIMRNDEKKSYEDDYEYIKRISKQLIDKAFPPANKYRLKKYNTLKDKSTFIYSSNREKTALAVSLVDFLIEKINEISNKKNFLLYKGNFNYIFLCFFGDSAREISNVCLSFELLINEIKNHIDDRNESKETRIVIFNAFNKFISVVLDINISLKNYLAYQHNLLLPDYTGFDIYVNYTEIINIYNSSKGNQLDEQEFIKLFVLLFFIENILVSITTEAKMRKYGFDEINKLFSMFSKSFYKDFIYNDHNTNNIVYQLGLIFDEYELINNFNFKEEIFQDKFLQLVFDYKIADIQYEKTDKFAIDIINAYNIDSKWTLLFLKILYLRCSNISCFRSNYKDDLILNVNTYFADDIISDTWDFLKNNIYSIIMKRNSILTYAQNHIRTYQNRFNNQIKQDDIDKYFVQEDIKISKFLESLKLDSEFVPLKKINNIVKKPTRQDILLNLSTDNKSLIDIYDHSKAYVTKFQQVITMQITDLNKIENSLMILSNFNKIVFNIINRFKTSHLIKNGNIYSVSQLDIFIDSITAQFDRFASEENSINLNTYYEAISDFLSSFTCVVRQDFESIKTAYEYLKSLKILEELHLYKVNRYIFEKLCIEKEYIIPKIQDYYETLCGKLSNNDYLDEIFTLATYQEKINKYSEVMGDRQDV